MEQRRFEDHDDYLSQSKFTDEDSIASFDSNDSFTEDTPNKYTKPEQTLKQNKSSGAEKNKVHEFSLVSLKIIFLKKMV